MCAQLARPLDLLVAVVRICPPVPYVCVRARAQLAKPFDLLVATPGRLREVMGKHVFLSQVQFTVLDEADTLCDKDAGFVDLVRDITAPMRARADPAKPHQFILVGASFSKNAQVSVYDLRLRFCLFMSILLGPRSSYACIFM